MRDLATDTGHVITGHVFTPKETSSVKPQRRIIEFLGLRRSVVALLTMVILVGMGEKLGERFLPIYILALGGTAYVIGLLSSGWITC